MLTPCRVRWNGRRAATGGLATPTSGVVAARRRAPVGLAVPLAVGFGASADSRFRLGRCDLDGTLARLAAQQLAHVGALGVPPVGQNAHVPADAEMLHAHIDVF